MKSITETQIEEIHDLNEAEEPVATEPMFVELGVVLKETNSLMVSDVAYQRLVATLKPIAARINGYTDFAAMVKVTTETEAGAAAAVRSEIVKLIAEVDEILRSFDERIMDRLFHTHRRWTALLKAFTEPLDGAARMIKRPILAWQTAELEKAEKERQKLQAEADERARIERDRLLKAAEKLKTPELKLARIEEAQQTIAPIIHVAAPKKAVNSRRRWIVAGVDKRAFIRAAHEQPILQGWLEVDEKGLAASKAANSELEVPGITFRQIVE